jgi:tetratricopeptide (TPR) repeat protein
VFLHLDAEKGEGPELAKSYKVKGFPTFILANAHGELIDRWIGYGGPAEFAKTVAESVADPTTFDQKKARYASSPTHRDAATLARITAARGESADALGYYRKALELDPTGAYGQPIFEQTSALYVKDKGATLEETIEAANAAYAEAQSNPRGKVNVAFGMLRVAKKADDMMLIAPYVDGALAATKGERDLAKARNELLIVQALHVTGEKGKAVRMKREGMPAGWMKDSGELNEFAWWCFENQVNLAEAEELARKGVGLAESGKEKAQVLDTVAEICNLRGSCTDAVSLIKWAMREDPDSDYYPKQLHRFEQAQANAS